MLELAPYAKAYAALIGSICTALLGVYTADTTIGTILTVTSVIATAIATFRVPNTPAKKRRASAVDPAANQD